MVIMERLGYFFFLLCTALLTAAPIFGVTRAPHGLYEIGGDAFTNPNISGLRAELKWSMSNPSDGVYDWARIDGLVANAVKNQKQIGLTLIMLSEPPTWVTALPGA